MDFAANNIDSGKSGGDCSLCVTASAKYGIDGHKKLHCYSCNKCFVKYIDFEHKLYFDMMVNIDEMVDPLAVTLLAKLGSFTWLCHSCRQKIRYDKNRVDDGKLDMQKPTWFKDLTAVLDAKFDEIDNKVNSNIDILAADLNNFKTNVNEKLSSFSHAATNNMDALSPLRKRKTPFPSQPACQTPAVTTSIGTYSTVVADNISRITPVDAPSYKAVLKLDNSDADANAAALKEMTSLKTQNGDGFPDFDCKASNDGSIKMLFKSFKDALNTKKLFDEKIKSVNVKNPVRKSMKKLDVVGLPFSVSKKEAMAAFVADNPALGLSLCADDPCSAELSSNSDAFITVVDVKKCWNKAQYRVLFSVTDGFINILEGVSSIKLLSCVLHFYISSNKLQCYNCSGFGHFSDKCTSPHVCAKCASPHHKTADCDSTTFKCINCVRRNLPNSAHPAYSHKCPCFK